MPRLVALILALFVVGAVACRTPPLDYDGGLPPGDLAGTTSSSQDMRGGSTGDMRSSRIDMTSAPPTSCCGVQGNPGNELGVGKFCQSSTECAGQKATTCATMFAPNLTFCTTACTMGGSANQCGSGAACQCAQNQCACIPGECVMPPPGC